VYVADDLASRVITTTCIEVFNSSIVLENGSEIRWFKFSDFGKTVFLTPEAAEAAKEAEKK
jgi:hypothetical protein